MTREPPSGVGTRRQLKGSRSHHWRSPSRSTTCTPADDSTCRAQSVHRPSPPEQLPSRWRRSQTRPRSCPKVALVEGVEPRVGGDAQDLRLEPKVHPVARVHPGSREVVPPGIRRASRPDLRQRPKAIAQGDRGGGEPGHEELARGRHGSCSAPSRRLVR